MRTAAVVVVVGLAMALVPAVTVQATATGADATAAAKKKKCKRGTALKTVKVKRTKKVRGKRKTVTVRVKKCVKPKAKGKSPAKPPVAAPPAGVPGLYKGRATSVDGKFAYGEVTINRSGNQVTYVEIKDVTASCAFPAGLRVLVYNPSSPDQMTLSGGPAINGNTMTVKFRPEKTVENDVIDLTISFSGNAAQGTFKEQGVCDDAGVFTASG